MMEIIWQICSIISTIALVGVFLYLIYLLINDRYLLLIAGRNVFRNTRRSLITIGAIAIGSVTIIGFGGFINDMYYGLRESTIRSQIGHMQIYKKGYNENGLKEPEKYRLKEFQKIIDTIESDEQLKGKVTAVIPVVEFSGLISSGDISQSFVARGMDMEKDRYLSTYDTITTGSKLEGEDRGLITMGYKLGQTLEAGEGDSVMLLISTSSVGLNVLDAEVKGFTRSYSEDYDKVSLKLPIEDAWMLMDEKYADHLIVMLDETNDLDVVQKRILELSDSEGWDVEYRTWEDLATFYNSVKNMYDGIFNFVKVVISIIIIVFITNTLFMAVMERVNETGSVRTIGTRNRTVVATFVIEGILMGIIGGILGLILSWVLAAIVNPIGIPMAPPPGSSTGFTATLRYDANSLNYFIFSFKLSVLTALLAAILPAKRAVNMSIVDALRHN